MFKRRKWAAADPIKRCLANEWTEVQAADELFEWSCLPAVMYSVRIANFLQTKFYLISLCHDTLLGGLSLTDGFMLLRTVRYVCVEWCIDTSSSAGVLKNLLLLHEHSMDVPMSVSVRRGFVSVSKPSANFNNVGERSKVFYYWICTSVA